MPSPLLATLVAGQCKCSRTHHPTHPPHTHAHTTHLSNFGAARVDGRGEGAGGVRRLRCHLAPRCRCCCVLVSQALDALQVGLTHQLAVPGQQEPPAKGVWRDEGCASGTSGWGLRDSLICVHPLCGGLWWRVCSGGTMQDPGERHQPTPTPHPPAASYKHCILAPAPLPRADLPPCRRAEAALPVLQRRCQRRSLLLRPRPEPGLASQEAARDVCAGGQQGGAAPVDGGGEGAGAFLAAG